METEIKNVLLNNNSHYYHIDYPESLIKIRELFFNKKLFEPTNDIEFLYLGMYYDCIKDYDLMEKNYLKAIELGNSSSMFTFGSYFYEKGDFQKMLLYFKMAANKGDIRAMHKLG